MKFEKATGKSIQQAFETFHKLNPKVYELFKQQVFRAINAGKKKLSSKMIINWIRWEHYIQTTEPLFVSIDDKPTQFKINDAYSSRYARLFVKEHPEHEEIFNMRGLRS